jgi:hypothetical protein
LLLLLLLKISTQFDIVVVHNKTEVVVVVANRVVLLGRSLVDAVMQLLYSSTS